MDIQEFKEKAAHYLNEIERGAIKELLHDEDAYHLFKIMLERMHRSVKSIYLRDFEYEDRTEIPDCYYEGYDSRNKLQRASSWLPIDFLSYKTILEAYCSSNRLSRHEALEELSHLVSDKYRKCPPKRLEQESMQPYFFFYVLNEVLSASVFTGSDSYIDVAPFSDFNNLIMGDISGVDSDEDQLIDLADTAFNAREKFSACLHSTFGSDFDLKFSTGYLVGIDLSCEQSVTDFLSNYFVEIKGEVTILIDDVKAKSFGDIYSGGGFPDQLTLNLMGRFIQTELLVPVDLSGGHIIIEIGNGRINPIASQFITLYFPIKITPEAFSKKGFIFASRRR